MKTKKCTKCGIEKPLTAEYYYKDNSKKLGFGSYCRLCKSEYQKNYQKNNKEKIAKRGAEYRKNNKEKLAKRRAEYYQNNKEKLAKRKAEYYQKNKERWAEYNVEYQKNNKEKLAEYKVEYRKSKQACVYQILNKVSGKIYIGQTFLGKLRWQDHRSRLRSNCHGNPKLQADFDKFGEEAFEWSIIKEMDKDRHSLVLEEAKIIDILLKQGKELYNKQLKISKEE